MSDHRERGDSLIEIIIAIVVIGVVVSAIVGAISTSENGSVAHRQLVTADTVMRNYAETVEQAVRTSCTSPGNTWSATYTQSGYTVNALTNQPCPSVTSVSEVAVQVTSPSGVVKTMRVAVRTP